MELRRANREEISDAWRGWATREKRSDRSEVGPPPWLLTLSGRVVRHNAADIIGWTGAVMIVALVARGAMVAVGVRLTSARTGVAR